MSLRRFLAASFVLAALAAPAQAAKPYDFNGDRRQDLVIGLPGWEDTDGDEAAALVALGARAPDLVGAPRLVTRNTLSVPPTNWDAMFGTSVASADFDADGKADLALGAPNLGVYEKEQYERRGAVVVAYGARPWGTARTTIVRQEPVNAALPFGDSLLAGDLDRDGAGDLFVGPGTLRIYDGTKGEPIGNTHRGTIEPPPEAPANYGYFLGLGDVTDDRRLDVFAAAPGVPESTDGEPSEHGHLAAAIAPEREARWVDSQMRGGPMSLALGDVDGDGYRDLVAGIPQDFFYQEDDSEPSGAVKVFWGGPDGPSERPMTITQASPGIPGTSEELDRFGATVAVGRLDRDRYADIVVGAPNEDDSRGRVTIIRGGPAGYSRKRNRAFGLDTRGVPGSTGRGDRLFGFSLTVLDFTGDGRPELAVTDHGIEDRARGGVSVFRGTKRGISFERVRRVVLAQEFAFPGDQAQLPRLGRADSSG